MSLERFRFFAEMLQLFVFTQFRTQNRCALLLELLWRLLKLPNPANLWGAVKASGGLTHGLSLNAANAVALHHQPVKYASCKTPASRRTKILPGEAL
ncbi:hypothetical protein ACFWXH_18240 [Mesorhizobium sp. NPDC059054]|uniref:hypothetical protein n=1 Tax=Mesorhizobium sp. NPDC059054 TaxID=3346711 RepID=UPI00367528AD